MPTSALGHVPVTGMAMGRQSKGHVETGADDDEDDSDPTGGLVTVKQYSLTLARDAGPWMQAGAYTRPLFSST
jgi:hypothetical protein